jgi:hypothetical protein
VCASRGGPRWLPAGSYKSYSAFFPGKWFKSVSPPEYLDLYNAILAKLDPRRVVDELEAFGPNPAMLWHLLLPSPSCCAVVSLGIKVEEVGHPDLPRFRYLRGKHFVPSYVRREPVEQLCLFDRCDVTPVSR